MYGPAIANLKVCKSYNNFSKKWKMQGIFKCIPYLYMYYCMGIMMYAWIILYLNFVFISLNIKGSVPGSYKNMTSTNFTTHSTPQRTSTRLLMLLNLSPPRILLSCVLSLTLKMFWKFFKVFLLKISSSCDFCRSTAFNKFENE